MQTATRIGLSYFIMYKKAIFSVLMIIYTGETVTCAIHMTLNLSQNQMWYFFVNFMTNSSQVYMNILKWISHIMLILRETVRLNEQNVPQV